MDSNINKSDFRFEEYKILKSFISIKRDELPDDEYNINISPSGIKSKDRFDLTLKIEIKDKNEVVSIDITVASLFCGKCSCNFISIYKSIYITTDIIVRCWNSFVANIEFVIFE